VWGHACANAAMRVCGIVCVRKFIIRQGANIAGAFCVSLFHSFIVSCFLCSLLPTPYSLLPTPYSLLPTPYSLLHSLVASLF
jgi:hypothetical protein